MCPGVHVDKFFNKLWLKGSWSDSPPPFRQFTGNMGEGSRRGAFQRSHVMNRGRANHRIGRRSEAWAREEVRTQTHTHTT